MLVLTCEQCLSFLDKPLEDKTTHEGLEDEIVTETVIPGIGDEDDLIIVEPPPPIVIDLVDADGPEYDITGNEEEHSQVRLVNVY